MATVPATKFGVRRDPRPTDRPTGRPASRPAGQQLLLFTALLFPLLDLLLSSPAMPAAPCSPGLWARTTHTEPGLSHAAPVLCRACHPGEPHSGRPELALGQATWAPGVCVLWEKPCKRSGPQGPRLYHGAPAAPAPWGEEIMRGKSQKLLASTYHAPGCLSSRRAYGSTFNRGGN